MQDFPHIRVKTDAQGRWQCSILPVNADPATRLWFFVEHPHYLSDIGGYSRRLSLKTARAMTGALILSSGVTVRGQVRDGKERPVPGARVVLAYSPSSAESIRTTTDAAGRFTFTHANNRNGLGRWSLSVEAPGFAPAWTLIVPERRFPTGRLPARAGQGISRASHRQRRPAGRRSCGLRPLGGVLPLRLERSD